MDSATSSSAQRQDEGLRERMRVSQPVDVHAVDQALATAGYGITTDKRTSDDKKTFGRTPDGTSKSLLSPSISVIATGDKNMFFNGVADVKSFLAMTSPNTHVFFPSSLHRAPDP